MALRATARALAITLAVAVVVLVFGRAAFLEWWFANTVDPENGEIALLGLSEDVSVRRDSLGIPVIDARNSDDLAFAMGYVMAHDRLEQMISFTLTAQGRLAEMAGAVALDMDVYFRTLGLRRSSERQYRRLSKPTRKMLEHFSDGVNAYITSHRDRLPIGFRLSGYRPQPWTPLNSLDLIMLMNLTVALNLQEEVNVLNIAQRVGWEKAAWLAPVYPDEPLPFEEAAKLAHMELGSIAGELSLLSQAYTKMTKAVIPVGIPASNNWAIAKERTRNGASILANDAHLMLTHPPMWMLMHVKCPEYDAGGLALPGLPAILFGFNGHIAWGATAVMADTQDLFVEKLTVMEGKLQYLYRGTWYPVDERTEEFRVLGAKPVSVTIGSTRHGPLITDVLKSAQINPIRPPRFTGQDDGRYGLAVSWNTMDPDDNMDALFEFAKATTFDQAAARAKDLRFIHLNLVFADRANIGWQVTGRYPTRRAGKGHFPSPGWTGDYDWEGFVLSDRLPREINPNDGFIGTANHRIVAPGSPIIISNSWFYPERVERITELIHGSHQHTAETSVMMQADRFERFSQKWKVVLHANHDALAQAISVLPDRDRSDAERALDMLLAFDGNLTEDSREGALYGIFQAVFTQEAFVDELGPADGPAYTALVRMSVLGYSAQQDHMLQRDDSPFWDDLTTPDRIETKWDIVARTLSRSWQLAERQLGGDSSRWRWGDVHTYTWESPVTQMKPYLGTVEQLLIRAFAGVLDRGPYPAGGDQNTLNQASYYIGDNFKTWMIPVTRMVVDFGREEPMLLVNSGGQSSNPVSPHYADGIEVWLSWKNRSLPFRVENIESQYRNVFRLRPRRVEG